MYLRAARRRKDGKVHVYWQLVRSVRQGRKVSQQVVVAHLGELDAAGQARAQALAESITGRGRGRQAELFGDARQPAEPVPVRLDQVRLERGRAFGAVWLGWQLWQALGFDVLCARLMPRGKEAVAWGDVVAILVIGRLCEPSSELHVAEDWYRSTALEDLLGVAVEQIYDERLYRALDRVRAHKDALEAHLVERLGELFAIEYDLLLYDVTSTYFEGVGAPALCKRGYSRDHRPDCVQVNIALVVTREGLPLGYQIFAGNTADVDTVEHIVARMEERYGRAQRVWVMDRGMVSAENLAWLQATGRRYVLGTPRSELRRWARALAEETNWRQIRDDVRVKICPGPDGAERFLLCRSEARVEKEKAIHARFGARIERGLSSLERRLQRSKRPVDRGAIERQIGRLLERNTRAAAAYSIVVGPDPAAAAGVRVTWSRQAEWQEWAAVSEGTYILRTNVADWSDEALWRTYIQLTEAKAAFRVHKSDLGLRPIWHHKRERIEAHILICFLACVLWKTLQQWQSRAGLGDSPRTILTELARIRSADIVVPMADGTARELRLRCVVRPAREQAILLQRLGLRLPQRLSPPQAVPMEM